MMSARLLVAAAALLLSAALFAQDISQNPSQVQENFDSASISPSRPLLIDKLGSTSATVPQNPLLRFEPTERPMFGSGQVSGTTVLNTQEVGPFAIPPDLFVDHYCLKIRSYLVARDSKNSDSTHFVGYSTCRPASKYRLRTAVESTQPALSH